MDGLSFIAGLGCTLLLLTVCFIVVFGVKALIVFLKNSISLPKFYQEPSPKKASVKKQSKPKNSKTLTINTDEIDRIRFVKNK